MAQFNVRAQIGHAHPIWTSVQAGHEGQARRQARRELAHDAFLEDLQVRDPQEIDILEVLRV